jgi:hypothetical protein
VIRGASARRMEALKQPSNKSDAEATRTPRSAADEPVTKLRRLAGAREALLLHCSNLNILSLWRRRKWTTRATPFLSSLSSSIILQDEVPPQKRWVAPVRSQACHFYDYMLTKNSPSIEGGQPDPPLISTQRLDALVLSRPEKTQPAF